MTTQRTNVLVAQKHELHVDNARHAAGSGGGVTTRALLRFVKTCPRLGWRRCGCSCQTAQKCASLTAAAVVVAAAAIARGKRCARVLALFLGFGPSSSRLDGRAVFVALLAEMNF
jgi:hypothetical protein